MSFTIKSPFDGSVESLRKEIFHPCIRDNVDRILSQVDPSWETETRVNFVLKQALRNYQWKLSNNEHEKQLDEFRVRTMEDLDISQADTISEKKVLFQFIVRKFADVILVTQQASVSPKEAIKALKKHNQDIVNAIMDLTM